ncbi:30S ribosomal protein S2 [Oscillatoria laete-virens NRMC-F 0139]|nr:30S ribosomal protein S2 [Oscillatoria laete-virens]MDL5054940.1 30S ribosomal protein S2 [Oscillatoria laete-virens NRMC-F 0139]
MKQLLETGVHFGHRTTKWNPKMKPYIYMERNGIHIIDLQQTLANLNQYYDMVRDIVAKGGTILFVGTKRQAQEAVAREAEGCGMPYINTRWLGGTLTNWVTIKKRIEALKSLERRRDNGEFALLPKKEALILSRKIEKLQMRLGGIRNLKKLPDLIVVIDTARETTALKEANTLKIPVLALADTNSDPDVIDYIIPANDDAVRAIKLLVSALAEAVREGQAMRKGDDQAEQEVEDIFIPDAMDDDEESDEKYLGASALAKVRDSKLFDEATDEE